MNDLEIIYKTGTAGVNEVTSHLMKCKDGFFPPLDKTVDISAYSKKIVQNAVTFEAWNNTELVALIAAYFNDAIHKTGYITNVSIVKGYSGKGIAAQLMQYCINYAGEKGFTEIVLEVNVANDQAIKLYKKFDFKQSASIAGRLTMNLHV